MVADAVIEARDVSYTYPDGTLGFNRLSLTIKRGERVAVLGPNGCGKSTLLMVLSGLLKPDTGKVLFEGRDIFEEMETLRRKIGFVFQDPDIFLFNPSVSDELSYALYQLELDEDEIRKRIDEFAGIFDLEKIMEKPPFRLSGGEKKRVEIASVLIYRPEILFLDEPTANVDGKTRRKMIEILKNYEGTMIFSTHEIDLVERLAERVVIMDLGKKIVYDGTRDILGDSVFLEEIGIL
ncbi:energy-coupling factor ABC transporter ATP-binding protein [Geoglobus acetivorans]|uniref:ATPase component NikO of energizing module of nickel ECF transporter n=1 Tax=Geoglobus acetivorans TaxID=565033 RepID=A0A0A7GCD8_GEOAI|nr:ATPase component NikO of energizing module of nickel ECF transporter [Geoglobus acetivorans]